MSSVRHNILLIEDNKIDQMAFKRFVDKNAIPYDCTIVGSVAESRSVLAGSKFDIIITDHSLGDGTALDVLESAANTPVIVVTGAGDEETAVKTWKAGAYDYLVKDISQNYLRAIPITVENAIKHKMMEEKVQLLSGAIMSTQDSVFITDMQDTIVFVNRAFCQTYGYREQEIVGQKGNMLWIGKHQSRSTRSVFQTKSVGNSWEVGFYHRRKDDSVFPVSLSRSPVKDTCGHDVAIVAVARDITDRIIVEEEIKTASLKLKKKSQLQNETAILVTEAVQKLLADGESETAQQVIADYLDVSRIDANKLELRTENVDLAALVSKSLEDLRPLAIERNVDLENMTPVAEGLVVKADRDRMAQVLRSLIGRAIQSSAANGRVAVAVKHADDELTVEIQDDGPPLERNELHRIVNRSDWIKEQFQAGREEMALGLRLAKELVEMHGGRIWSESSDSRPNTLCFAVSKSGVPHSQEVPVRMSPAGAD